MRLSGAGRGVRMKAVGFLACLERDGLARRCDLELGTAEGYVLTDWGAHAIDGVSQPRYRQ
jgi:hypothetical protein